MTKFSTVETGVDGVAIFQADGRPSLEDCGGIEAAREFFAAQQRPAINQSGIAPLDLRVLVKPDDVEKKIGSIIIPESTSEQKKFAMQKGTLIAVGENAWEEAAARSPQFVKPKVGDRVLIAKYGGVRITGLDEAEYILMNDEDVIGRLEE